MKVDPNIPADRLYNEGLLRIDSKDYEGAAKHFADVQKQFPFSQWARKGLLMEIYADYLNGSYTETTAAADRYHQLYPKHRRSGLCQLSGRHEPVWPNA